VCTMLVVSSRYGIVFARLRGGTWYIKSLPWK
jgi:hypothetical protein